jgi:hypothetical protein
MYEAAKAIWIVAEPRPEHVTAVTWLNQSSADVYLLKAEAIQIGGPPAALLLTRIVGPKRRSAPRWACGILEAAPRRCSASATLVSI